MKNKTAMNLYIIKEVLSLYHHHTGLVVIAAENLERCRELFIAKFGDVYYTVREYDEAIRLGNYKVLSVANQSEGVVSYVYGGA
jgi:hypothetical protein